MKALRFRWGWLALGWAMLVATAWMSLTPFPPQPLAFSHADKIEHLLVFTWLTLWFVPLCQRHMGAAFGVLVFGVGIEVAQSFTATRTFELADIVADAMGALVGYRLAQGRLGDGFVWVEGLFGKGSWQQ